MVLTLAGCAGLLSLRAQQAIWSSGSTSAAAAALAGFRRYHVARLATRGVISFSGPESIQFLQVGTHVQCLAVLPYQQQAGH